VTGVPILARKVPDTLPTRYSVVAFAATAIMVNTLQMAGEPDINGVAVIGALPGQHSIVTAPADTEPLPVMRNVVNLGSEKNWFRRIFDGWQISLGKC